MVSTVTFLAPSGAAASGTIIDSILTPGSTSGKNRVGFFGVGGPEGTPKVVIVDRWQDRTFITNMSGTNLGVEPFGVLGSGELINAKYVSSSTVNMGNQDIVNVEDVPLESGTILVRFENDSDVQTQNVVIRTVALNASSGVVDITAIVTDLKTQGFEPGGDNSWTQMAGVGALDNRMFFIDHDDADTVHDFFACISASPEDAGVRYDFGLAFVLEFL